jgi:hypothetical protein
MSSKLNIGSVIWNATTGVEQGNILHSNALKTVNGTSLVGSGDFSPLSFTLIGTTSSASATFTHTISQYKALLFQYESGNAQDSKLERYQVTSITHSFQDTLEQGGQSISYNITATNITITGNTDGFILTIHGVK